MKYVDIEGYVIYSPIRGFYLDTRGKFEFSGLFGGCIPFKTIEEAEKVYDNLNTDVLGWSYELYEVKFKVKSVKKVEE